MYLGRRGSADEIGSRVLLSMVLKWGYLFGLRSVLSAAPLNPKILSLTKTLCIPNF